MLLECNPCLAKYSTFGGLNSPLHFAAAKGHNEIVALLLENGADVNSRNYCGQTALMQACWYGHWEVVQTLLLFRCNVTRVDYLSGRTALHFAAVNGHVRCIRLVVADFVPSAPYEVINAPSNGDRGDRSILKNKYDQRQAATGDEIVEALIANSATFEKKTSFSQEKYRLRKQKKYAPRVLLKRPFARRRSRTIFWDC